VAGWGGIPTWCECAGWVGTDFTLGRCPAQETSPPLPMHLWGSGIVPRCDSGKRREALSAMGQEADRKRLDQWQVAFEGRTQWDVAAEAPTQKSRNTGS